MTNLRDEGEVCEEIKNPKFQSEIAAGCNRTAGLGRPASDIGRARITFVPHFRKEM
jgi:hypothetical protein